MLDNARLFNSNQLFGYKNIIWDYAEVVDIDDPYDAGRIRDRIPVVDKDTSIQNQLLPFKEGGLPWCEPLLPKYINVVPELGQLVKIIVFNTNDKKMRRQYVGPVIGQQTPQDLLNIIAFAKMVAKHEREACAKVCEDISITGILLDAISCNHTKNFCAHTIRARGKA